MTQTVLDFALGNFDQLWTPVTSSIEVHDIGQRPYQSNQYFAQLLELFEGVQRT